MDRVVLSDDVQTFEFDGRLIAHDSTDMKNGRWTEVDIYLTDSNKFVTQVTGGSRVFHLDGAICASGKRVMWGDVSTEYEQCPRCRPDDTHASDNISCRVEVPRRTVRTWNTWEEMVDGLRIRRSSDGQRTLSSVTVRALASARSELPDELQPVTHL